MPKNTSSKRIGVNGFGRIGRTLARVLERTPGYELAVVNDLSDAPTLAHLLKYDSLHRAFPAEVASDEDHIYIEGRSIPVLNHKTPDTIPWSAYEVDVVVEATGQFKYTEQVAGHLMGGAPWVVLSVPPIDQNMPTVVLGINDEILDGSEHMISNASCTTNCAAPMVGLIDELCGVEEAYITTVHSFTGDQRLHDAPHKDLRRARAATQSIVPTTTGAAKAVTRIFPHLEGNIGGCGIRVPVPDGSLTDITFIVKKPVSAEEINAYFKQRSEGDLKGILGYTEDPIVSSDVIGSPYSCLHDAQMTSVLGNMVKIIGWYDNEMGYSTRLVDLIKKRSEGFFSK
ncbi:type I glyceraldehyde-3-phosphate dehydrogenase [Cryomorphaceae bacterium]|nr:type I glyceraldehyde-3-phosphate dehydrogenase [Cryomorphaceae bacterium]